jgi:hypothetical protein
MYQFIYLINNASPIRELKRHRNQDEPYRKDNGTYYSNYYRLILGMFY